MKALTMGICAMFLAMVPCISIPGQTPAPSSSTLEEMLASQAIPPAWFDSTPIEYDLTKPWSEARNEIRRLLSTNDPNHLRQAIKMTVLYAQKKDIGNGHELPMYLFMGGEFAWAILEYRKFLQPVLDDPIAQGDTHGFDCLAACYLHFNECDMAIQTMEAALLHLPDPPYRDFNAANAHNRLGDAYRAKGDLDKAREHYEMAIGLYRDSKQPFGRHLLPRRIEIIQDKIERMTAAATDWTRLPDGRYTASALGYSDMLDATVIVRGGRIVQVDVAHHEKIELGAAKIIPGRIVASQSLDVDGVTGATVTCQAILSATHAALKKAAQAQGGQ
ncbi:MAG: FMN-binding domain protein [candidate division BRC1 bacterium ADurb.BinA364]|nr:MAG: FMN-binding domain protein [candidate division BRC1 bacterium ADurb.BinA364]